LTNAALGVNDVSLQLFNISSVPTGTSTWQGAKCCGYGTDGQQTAGYDCLFVNGAENVGGMRVQENYCGRKQGLITVTAVGGNVMAGKTICCKSYVINVNLTH